MIVDEKKVVPYLKWAGGKRQLLPEINKYIPSKFNTFFEPFVGAGAVLFNLKPNNAVINDINKELIASYKVIKYNVDELIEKLNEHKLNHETEYYYKVRNLDRSEKEYQKLSDIEKAARLIYLNKTCFNGLYRVNRKGHFNVPIGRYKNPNIVNEEVLRAINTYFNENKVEILNTDFEKVVQTANKGDFVYFDPPYDPLSVTSSFTSYSLDGFDKSEQIRLSNVVKELDSKGVKVLLSNSNTEFINDIYSGLEIKYVDASRSINSKAKGRGKIQEVLVMNYEPDSK